MTDPRHRRELSALEDGGKRRRGRAPGDGRMKSNDNGLPKVQGVGRVADNERALLVMVDRRPTDDELRLMHDLIKVVFNWDDPMPIVEQWLTDRKRHPVYQVREEMYSCPYCRGVRGAGACTCDTGRGPA